MKPISLLFSVALLAACGVSPTASPTTYQDYAIAQNQVSCEARFRCCASQCSAGTDLTFNKSLLSVQKLIDAGKLTFDANAGKACLDSIRASYMDCELTANSLPSLSPMCNLVVVGKLALGQTCTPIPSLPSVNVCVSGTYCDQAQASPVCSNYLSDGAPCGAGGRCATTSYCDVTGNQTCKPVPKSGQACTTFSGCDSTATKLVCLPSMFCGPPVADNGACSAASQCLSGTCGTAMPRSCLPLTTPPDTLRDSLCR